MDKSELKLFSNVKKSHPIPLYSQLVNAVLAAVRQGILIEGHKVPSINSLSKYSGIGRSTIEKAYCDLVEMGVLESYRGKGFFVKKSESFESPSILFFFSEFSGYEKMIFDAFSKVLGHTTAIEMAVYHNDTENLARIISEQNGNHSHYLIVPKLSIDNLDVRYIISRLPEHKVIILDHRP